MYTRNLRTSSRGKQFKINAARKYPLSRYYHEHYIKRLNSKNVTEQTNNILGTEHHEDEDEDEDDIENDEYLTPEEKELSDDLAEIYNMANMGRKNANNTGHVRIFINRGGIGLNYNEPDDDDDYNDPRFKHLRKTTKKSDNFEVIETSMYNFTDIGGYDNIKKELDQVVDILSNYTKYSAYNVRIPKGLIFEGPPGNGKTLFAKALAGEAKLNFITASGSEFMEKYVGTGPLKVRELFKLATENVPCIIFIDEIDAIGRKRSGEGEASNTERDSTLNELLVSLDGFKNTSGVFLIGATNRADLLDPALIRPGRIDKRIFIGNPDEKTRSAIIDIHLKGKPLDSKIQKTELVEQTSGLSGAQIENLMNEAMLNALRYNRECIGNIDIDLVLNKIMVGWQPNEHIFTNDIIDHIAIHELGHAIVGLLSKHHSKMTKVIINLSAPKSPAYTVFENSVSNILTREALFEHLMILLAGRVAEEVFYGVSVSTGAINDFEEALKLAQRMIVYYGMGKKLIYPNASEKYKEIIDNEVADIIGDAYGYSEFLIRNSKDLIMEGAELLKTEKLLTAETLIKLMNEKYQNVLSLKFRSGK
jgi:cell division protease FtsH